MPLPAPAVSLLLRGLPAYGVELKQELVTPTGAALIKGLAEDYGEIPPMIIDQTGYGAGTQSLDNGQPNLLRCILGSPLYIEECQEVEVIETNIDDSTPEIISYLMEQLLEKGALDVVTAPVLMKKGRPGYALQVIADPVRAEAIKTLLLTETTSIGLRFRRERRRTLKREKVTVASPWGEVEAKLVERPDGPRVFPEFDVCRSIARKEGVPLMEVYRQIQTSQRMT
jgi:uncharacterized protein (DUF111 family)